MSPRDKKRLAASDASDPPGDSSYGTVGTWYRFWYRPELISPELVRP
jgi:hypothetical protein